MLAGCAMPCLLFAPRPLRVFRPSFSFHGRASAPNPLTALSLHGRKSNSRRIRSQLKDMHRLLAVQRELTGVDPITEQVSAAWPSWEPCPTAVICTLAERQVCTTWGCYRAPPSADRTASQKQHTRGRQRASRVEAEGIEAEAEKGERSRTTWAPFLWFVHNACAHAAPVLAVAARAAGTNRERRWGDCSRGPHSCIAAAHAQCGCASRPPCVHVCAQL